jgi:hypothetical protein
MMPDPDLRSTPTSRAPTTSPVQPAIVSTKPSLHDLFTGGWKRPLTGLPRALGRPLARGLGMARSRAAVRKTRTSERNAQH